jgi:hypothetical protein
LMEKPVISVVEGVAVLINRRRWHGRVAETGMVFKVWWTALSNVVTSGLEPIVKALLIDCAGYWWRRRWCVVSGLWVRTASEDQRRC